MLKTISLIALTVLSTAAQAQPGDPTSASQPYLDMSRGNVLTGNAAAPHTSCIRNGVIAQNSDGSGQYLSCEHGMWVAFGGPGVVKNTETGVHDGEHIRAPHCEAGAVPQAIVLPTPEASRVAGATLNYELTKDGDGWRVQIHRHDAAGNKQDGAGVSATVQTACVS